MLATHLCELCLSVVLTPEIDLLRGTLGKTVRYKTTTTTKKSPLQHNGLMLEAGILPRAISNVCDRLAYPIFNIPQGSSLLLSASPHSCIKTKVATAKKQEYPTLL